MLCGKLRNNPLKVGKNVTPDYRGENPSVFGRHSVCNSAQHIALHSEKITKIQRIHMYNIRKLCIFAPMIYTVFNPCEAFESFKNMPLGVNEFSVTREIFPEFLNFLSRMRYASNCQWGSFNNNGTNFQFTVANRFKFHWFDIHTQKPNADAVLLACELAASGHGPIQTPFQYAHTNYVRVKLAGKGASLLKRAGVYFICSPQERENTLSQQVRNAVENVKNGAQQIPNISENEAAYVRSRLSYWCKTLGVEAMGHHSGNTFYIKPKETVLPMYFKNAVERALANGINAKTLRDYIEDNYPLEDWPMEDF